MRAHLRARGGRGSTRDGGFTLVEVLVSIVLLGLVMTAIGTLFVRSMRSSSGLQGRQSAVPVASQAMDLARSVPALRDTNGDSKLVGGRTSAAVTTQWASVAGLPGVDLSATYKTWDTTATSTSVPTLPLTTTVILTGKTFNVTTLVGVCYRASVNGPCTKLGGYTDAPFPAPAGQVALYRVIVVVSFTSAADPGCSAGCVYVSSTLIDPSSDPTFNTNDSTVPPPLALADAVTVTSASPGVTTTVDVLGNDSGTFGTFPVVILVSPAKGTVAASGTGIVTFTATANASGTDYFTYYLRDVTGRASTPATVAVTILPRANDDSAVTGKGKAVTFDVKGNDNGTFPTTGTTCVQVVTAPSNGTVALGTCGALTYTPNAAFTGTDSFTYKITDTSALGTGVATVSVTVYPPPTAANDAATVNAGSAVAIGVQANDTLPAGSATNTVVTAPGAGSATVSGTTITYTAPASFSGATSFTYRLTDAWGNTSNTATVSVTIRPVAVADTLTVGQGKSGSVLVTTNDRGTFGSNPISAPATTSKGGTLSVGGGSITYTGASTYSGTDSFTYTLTDTSGQTSTATVTITVVAKPVAVADSFACVVKNSTTTTLAVLANDTGSWGSSPVILSSGSSTAGGNVSVNTSGVVTYKPKSNFASNGPGADTFQYYVVDAYGNTSPLVTVTIQAVKTTCP